MFQELIKSVQKETIVVRIIVIISIIIISIIINIESYAKEENEIKMQIEPISQNNAEDELIPKVKVSMANAGSATDVSKKEYYYHDKATVIIESQEDFISGIRIEVIGANKIEANSYKGVTSKEIEITKEGESVVKAWLIDNEGNILEKSAEITIHIDNEKPEISDLNLEVTKGTSLLDNGWYNSEEVAVKITRNINEEQNKRYKTLYGTRNKCINEELKNVKELTANTETIIIKEEGITEVIVYRESYSGAKSDIKTIDVPIDRIAPTIGELTYTQLENNKVKMSLGDIIDNKYGSGMNRYLFYVDNGDDEQIVLNSAGPEVLIDEVKPRSLVSVIAIDNAGNYAATSTPYAQTQYPNLYKYSVYPCYAMGDLQTITLNQEINAYLTIRNQACLMNLFQTITPSLRDVCVSLRWSKRIPL